MRWIFILLPLVLFVPSCTKGLYIAKLGFGEAKILWGSIPIQDVLKDQSVEETVKERLRLVQEVREFARQKIGLRLDGSYEAFYQVRGDTLIHLVSACPKDSLEPYTWRFPIVGKVSYKGFFDKRDALEERKRLEKRGLDTSLQRVMAFSTLGWLPDPIYSTILDSHPVIIISTIIHELVHNTIYFKGQTELNEQLATFIGEKGALMFIGERFGSSSPHYNLALDLVEDEQVVARFIQGLYDKLRAFYAQEMPWTKKMQEREEIFAQAQSDFMDLRGVLKTAYFSELNKGGFNNALILAYRRYLTPPDSLFEKVYDVLGRDLRSFVGLMRGLGDEKESIYLCLDRWLNASCHHSCD